MTAPPDCGVRREIADARRERNRRSRPGLREGRQPRTGEDRCRQRAEREKQWASGDLDCRRGGRQRDRELLGNWTGIPVFSSRGRDQAAAAMEDGCTSDHRSRCLKAVSRQSVYPCGERPQSAVGSFIFAGRQFGKTSCPRRWPLPVRHDDALIQIDMASSTTVHRVRVFRCAPGIRRLRGGPAHQKVRRKPFSWCCSTRSRRPTRDLQQLCRFSRMAAHRRQGARGLQEHRADLINSVTSESPSRWSGSARLVGQRLRADESRRSTRAEEALPPGVPEPIDTLSVPVDPHEIIQMSI